MERYREYKESGVKWLGEIPSHWEVVPLRKYLKINTRRNMPEAQLLSVTREEGVIVRNVESKEENHNYIPDDLSNYKYVQRGQFVINKMKSWQGSYGVSNYDGIVSPAYFVYDLNYPNKDYFNIAIRSKIFSPFFSKYSKGIRVDQWDLTPEALKIIPFLEPPKAEQDAFVRYLDSATSELDKAIAMQQKMIDLLNERKQIIIQNAVTKGLDENVEMKESGVEWIDFLPAKWAKERLKYIVDFISDKAIANKNTNNISLENIVSHSGEYVKTESEYDGIGVQFHYDDILFGKLRPYLAKVHLCKCDGIALGDIYVLRCHNNFDPNYLHYLLLSDKFIQYVNSSTYGTKMPRTNWGFVGNINIAYPSYEEQVLIGEYLDKQMASINSAISSYSRQITLLQERKQIIINEVVTGKVRVS